MALIGFDAVAPFEVTEISGKWSVLKLHSMPLAADGVFR